MLNFATVIKLSTSLSVFKKGSPLHLNKSIFDHKSGILSLPHPSPPKEKDSVYDHQILSALLKKNCLFFSFCQKKQRDSREQVSQLKWFCSGDIWLKASYSFNLDQFVPEIKHKILVR